MKEITRLISIITLLLWFIFSAYTSSCCFGQTIHESANKSDPNVFLLLPQPFLQNTAIASKNNDNISFNNNYSSRIKNTKTSLALLPFIEQHNTSYFKKYTFYIKNRLIHYGRKAIFFPFQYFW